MDIILYNIIACLVSLIFGYFFGSIPTGVILCKLIYHEDPRQNGSKNSGGTNVGRLYGKKMGLLTIILDGIKTLLPMILVWVILNFSGLKDSFINSFGENFYHNGAWIIMLAPLGATFGHCWPIFAGFKGGKAVANYAGFTVSTNWLATVLTIGTFFTTLKIRKHVSLASLVGSCTVVLVSWTLYILGVCLPDFNANFAFWGFGINDLWATASLEYCIVSTIIALMIIVRHIPNIKRLASGTESKIKWMK